MVSGVVAASAADKISVEPAPPVAPAKPPTAVPVAQVVDTPADKTPAQAADTPTDKTFVHAVVAPVDKTPVQSADTPPVETSRAPEPSPPALPAPAGTAGRAAAFNLRKLLEANASADQGRPPKTTAGKPADPGKASHTGDRNTANPRQPSPAGRRKTPSRGQQPSDQAKNVSPQISDMIRKLNELQALLRLD